MLHGAGQRTRSPLRRIVRAGAAVLSVWLVINALPSRGASASTPFTAAGSVEQVYVTGLAPGAAASLISPAGAALSTQNANSLRGLLFRNVPPGAGYVVR